MKLIRDDSIYVNWQLRTVLNCIARAKEVGTEDLAEQWLWDRVKADHPEVVEHFAKRKEADESFDKAMSAKLKPKRPLE